MNNMLKNKSKLIALIFILLMSKPSFANNKEYALKAGFLFNFARLGHWQSHNINDAKFTICSPDENFIAVANSVISGRTVHTHTIENKYTPISTADFSQCDMVFITNKNYKEWEQSPLQLDANIMLVGENSGFIEHGGHIRFFLAGGKVRFEISTQRLRNAGLSMSSKVLRLARLVDK